MHISFKEWRSTCRHVMPKCRSRDGLCFSGTNLRGNKKNLQSFEAAAVSTSLLPPSLYTRACFLLCFYVKYAAQNKKKLHLCRVLSLQLPSQFLHKGYQHQAMTTKKLEAAFATLAHSRQTSISCRCESRTARSWADRGTTMWQTQIAQVANCFRISKFNLWKT